MKNIGGYVLVDCGGLDLTSESTQTIPGLYKQCQDALATKKQILAENCIWGTGKSISPIPVFGIQISSTEIIFTSSTLQVAVDDDNEVTITNMAPAN